MSQAPRALAAPLSSKIGAPSLTRCLRLVHCTLSHRRTGLLAISFTCPLLQLVNLFVQHKATVRFSCFPRCLSRSRLSSSATAPLRAKAVQMTEGKSKRATKAASLRNTRCLALLRKGTRKMQSWRRPGEVSGEAEASDDAVRLLPGNCTLQIPACVSKRQFPPPLYQPHLPQVAFNKN